MKKVKFKDLVALYKKENTIYFDMCNHPRIPNNVLINGQKIGCVTISTKMAFEKWVNSLNTNLKIPN
jgi:hypothetical protein